MFTFLRDEEDFLFGSSFTLRDLTDVTSSIRIDVTLSSRFTYTSIGGLTDMGTHGSPPTRVSTVPDRQARPTRRPADLSVDHTDLQEGPETLSTILATLEDFG
jgi:hypothetical protein